MPDIFVDSDGNVVRPANEDESRMFRDSGMELAQQKDLRHEQVVKEFSSWQDQLGATASGMVGVLPSLTSAVLPAAALGRSIYQGIPYDQARNEVSQITQGTQEANPGPTLAGQALGLAGTIAATGGVGVGAGATSLAGKAAVLAGEGATLGVALKADELALEHASTPEGSEKLFSQLMTAGAVGAVLNVGIGAAVSGLGKAFKSFRGKVGATGDALEAKAAAVDQKRMMTDRAIEKISEGGRNPEVIDYMKKRELVGKPIAEVEQKLAEDMAEAKGYFHQAHTGTSPVLQLQEQIQLTQQLLQMSKGLNRQAMNNALKPLLGAKADKTVKILRGGASASELKPILGGKVAPASVINLHSVRLALDKAADHEHPSSIVTQQLGGMRSLLDDAIGTLISRSPNQELANAWTKANYLFRNAASVKAGLRKVPESAQGSGFGLGTLGGVVSGAGAAGYAAGEVAHYADADEDTVRGFRNLGGGLALAGAGILGVRKHAPELANSATHTLASLLSWADHKMAGVIVDRFNGSNGGKAAATMGQLAAYAGLYNLVAPILKQNSAVPGAASEKLAQQLNDNGVPGQLQSAMITVNERSQDYLKTLLPQNPYTGATAVPQQWQPTRQDKHRLEEALAAIQHPMAALAHPTQGNLAAVRAVYPSLYAKFQQQILDIAPTRPQMDLPTRKWVSMHSGMPGDAMSTPQASMALQQLDAMQAMQQQMQAQKYGGGQGKPSGGTSKNQRDVLESYTNQAGRMSQ